MHESTEQRTGIVTRTAARDAAADAVDGPEVRSADGTVLVRIDPCTGLPAMVCAVDGTHELTRRLTSTVEVVTGGVERPGPYGGLSYVDTQRATSTRLLGRDVEPMTAASEGTTRVHVDVAVGDCVLRWHYTLGPRSPRVRVDLELRASTAVVVRDIVITLVVSDVAADDRIAAPGNRVRPGILARDVGEVLRVNTAGGTAGSSGLVAVSSEAATHTFAVWPLARQAIGSSSVRYRDGALAVRMETGVAGAVPAGGSLTYGPLYLELHPGSWRDMRRRLHEWCAHVGVTVPADGASWIRTASLYEAHIGTALFGGVANYAPYPRIDDLRADLDRIHDLGFTALQVMPRQPFPSYNVVDYADIDTTYGGRAGLIALVQAAHERGMKVILDVVMHGVLDRRSISAVAERVRTGPHGAFIAAHLGYSADDAATLPDAAHLPWSQHILDFEHAWTAQSPDVHPLTRDHPEWFYRTSDGELSGIYTWAFEFRNADWEAYFRSVLETYIADLAVDGFRFDAPTYNAFPNWSEGTRSTASRSELAAIDVFARLRRDLVGDRRDLAFYTEPSGILLRSSMDVNYNYDEHAQLEDLLQWHGVALGVDGASSLGVRTAREFAAWLVERDAALPEGAVTAHHIDSHDTYWWPRPGLKWRREQVGIAASTALFTVCALCPGPYMTYAGGELGMEDRVRVVHRIRARPEFRAGRLQDDVVVSDDPHVFCVTRSCGAQTSLVLVNMSAGRTTARLTSRGPSLASSYHDLISGRTVPLAADAVSLQPYQAVVVDLSGSEDTGE